MRKAGERGKSGMDARGNFLEEDLNWKDGRRTGRRCIIPTWKCLARRSLLLHPNCRKFRGFCDSLMSPRLFPLRELFIQYLVMRMGGNLVAFPLPPTLSVSALSSFTSAAVLRSYKSQIRPREEESVARGEEDF